MNSADPHETVPLSLEVLATEVVALVHEAAQAKGLSVRVERSPGTAWCLGDPTRLRQAVLNLMGNAVKFTRSGEVTLRIERDPAALHVAHVLAACLPVELQLAFEFAAAEVAADDFRLGVGGLVVIIEVVEVETIADVVPLRRARRPWWVAQWPIILVLLGASVAMVLIAMVYFRRGSVVLSASVLLAAFLRLLLPDADAGMLVEIGIAHV